MHRSIIRILLVVALAAGFLVPELVAPVRAISRPTTLSARHAFPSDARAGRLELDIAPTHGMFSWSGDEGSGVSYRFKDNGSWTNWRRAPEAHDMEAGARHYSSPLLLRRSQRVEWRAFKGAEDVVIDYVNTIDGPVRRIEIPAAAQAGGAEPDVVTRAEWGADESIARRSGSCERSFAPVQQMFVHHTVTSNSDPNPASTVRAIYYFHVESRGWCDIGYNFVVGQNGQVFEGRWARDYKPWETHDGEDEAGRVVTGAHVSGFNTGSIGVSVLGNYQSAPIGDAARRALVRVLAWKADEHDLKPRGSHTYKNASDGTRKYLPYLAGHRDAGDTTCPGSRLQRTLPSIRKEVARKIGAGKLGSDLIPEPPEPATFGERVDARFRLQTPKGAGLADKRITFYKRGESQWSLLGHARTNETGWARLRIEPQRDVYLRAVWVGDDRRWGDEAGTRLKVRPLVTMSAEGGVESSPGVYQFNQGTSEVYVVGEVAPDHAGRKVILQTWQRTETGSSVRLEDRTMFLNRDSALRAKLSVPESGGTYRVRTVIGAHGDHATGKSSTIEIVVPPPLVPIPDE